NLPNGSPGPGSCGRRATSCGEPPGTCSITRGRSRTAPSPRPDRVALAAQCLHACPPAAPGLPAQAVRPAAEAFREGSPGKAWSMDPAELLRYAVERRASGVHLKAGDVPVITGVGEV